MNDIAEGIGGAIEGALLGGAVEKEDGAQKAAQGGDGSGACPNCGSDPAGTYCQNCGQKVHVHRSLAAIGHDLIHGVLHLDGKFWNTIPLLAFKPGQLTRRYIEGERAKFVSPMAMFLFSVFAMFAVFQMIGLTTPTTFDDQIGGEEVESSLQSAIENNERTLREIEAELANVGDDIAERERLETRRTEVLTAIDGLKAMAGLASGEEDPSATEDTVIRAEPFTSETGIEFLDEGLAKKWRENPGLMLYKLQANAYKFSWLLIPLSIPFVWLVFAWRRRFKAYDHAIFVTYSLSFMSLLFITVSLIALIPVEWLAVLLIFFVPPIHLYKQLRGAYQIGRFGALWRLFVLSAFIWIVVALFLQALLLLGAF